MSQADASRPHRTHVDRLTDWPVNAFVAGRIRALRIAKGLPMAEVARRAGIPFGTYGGLETGRYRLGLDRLYRLLFAVGASISDVWPDATGDGKPVTRKSIRLAVSNAEQRLPKRQTIAGILEAVARDFGVSVEDLAGPRRTKRLSDARAQAMQLVRAEDHLKVNDLARALGRDPSSLAHLLRRRARRSSRTQPL